MAAPSAAHPLPLVSDRRQRKRWCYVAAFAPEAMVCAGSAEVGVLRRSWWAVWDRRAGRLAERSWRSARGIVVEPGRARVPGVLDLEVDLAGVEPFEVRCPAGRAHTWTRKRAGAPMAGWVALDGERVPIRGTAVVDESAGHHARRLDWRWSAGAGTDAGGRPVAWNLVTGINDPPTGSERAVWVDGRPREVGPVRFAADLSSIESADGAVLRFTREAVRAHRERWVVFASDYEQPFGTFSGTLPGGVELREGMGVMERHAVLW